VTIAIRPSVGWDSAGYGFDLGQARRGIFLERGLDRGNQQTARAQWKRASKAP
jgi:hypothetical protein